MTATRPRNGSGEFTRADGTQREDRRPRWTRRNRVGEFCTALGFNRSLRSRLLAEWHAYLEMLQDQADDACRGLIERRFFYGASLRSASAELREWFEVNGPVLSYGAFVAQSVEREW